MTLKLEPPTGEQQPSEEMTLNIPQEPEKRERLAALLYDARMVSQGNAAKIAGLCRADFLQALGKYGVTPFQYDSVEDILADAEAARL
jgi:predicted HTH domain antitoxin